MFENFAQCAYSITKMTSIKGLSKRCHTLCLIAIYLFKLKCILTEILIPEMSKQYSNRNGLN